MAKKEKKWNDLAKGEKIEWLRVEIDKILVGIPRATARSTKRLTDAESTLSDEIRKLTAKVDRLAKELQDTKKKLQAVGTAAPEGPTVS